MARDQPRLLLIAPYYDRNVPSESWSTYKWVSGISERYETTVLTTHRQGWRAAESPVRAEVVNWVEPKLPQKLRHVDYGVRPQYALFVARVRQWVRRQERAGRHFDLIHQVCGVLVEATNASDYVAGLARAIVELVEDPEAFRRRSEAALARMEDIAMWPRKIDQLSKLYADVLRASNATEHVTAPALAHGSS